MTGKPKIIRKPGRIKSKKDEEGECPTRRKRNRAAWVLSPMVFAVIIGALSIVQAVDGHWEVWWVKWLCVPSLILGLSLAIGELLYQYFGLSVRISSTIAVAASVVLAASAGSAYLFMARAQSWEPPELPIGCTKVTASCGVSMTMPVESKPWTPLFVSGPDTIVSCVVNDRRLYVSAKVGLGDGIRYEIRDMGFRGDLPPSWDRNSSSNAFEIVGPDGLPVFQLYYKSPEHVVIQGLFPTGPNGYIFAFDNQVINATREQLPVFLSKRRALFKYPAWKFPGVIADQ